ncbi:MAG TPA: kelch repeat-containing protein [Chitinophagales bacterium]|nr:kelch repeat-containing protein [Chitinophagales bacterium]
MKLIKLFLPAILLSFVLQSTAQSIGQWQAITSSTSPTARHECSYVAVGNKFYLVGGRGTKPVQVYDPAVNSWVTETNPPMQMHHFQAIQYNGKVYVVGAFTGNCCHETPIPNIYIYNPVTKVWTVGPEIPAARRRGAAGCVVYNNKFYLVCGIIDGHSSGWVPWLDVYDPQTNTWTQLSDAPRARDHFHATVANGKIYAIGGRRSGFNGNIFAYTTAEVDVYDIAGNSWTTLPPSLNIPTQRAACPTAVIGDEILVIGGEGAQVAYATTEAFNYITQTWRTLAPMNQSRHATSAIVYNNEVYIACGANTRGGSVELNTQEKFSFTSPPPGGCVPNEVVSFTLVKAGTAGDIGPLTDGMTINLATIGSFSIRANKCQNGGSVKFILNGSTVRTESSPPYAINGDNAGSYIAWNPTVGSKILTATPYTGSGGSGTAGISETVSFTVVNQPSGTPDCNGVPGGTAFIDDCGVCSGGNTGHVANSDKDACGVCFGDGSSCSGCQPLQVTQFTLVRAGFAGDIGPLNEGMTINLATIGSFSIRADICPGSTSVKSVKFVLNGATVKIENIAPYAIAGDGSTTGYNKWNVSPGSYTLTATPYSGSNASGTSGISLTRHFTVINQAAKTELLQNAEPDNVEKLSAFPNPFSRELILEFSVTEDAEVRLEVFNISGKKVATVFNGMAKKSLQHKAVFIPQNLSSGIYFCRLHTASKVITEKVLYSSR